MNHTFTIARRELSCLFFSPIAYAAIAVFAVVATLLFFTAFAPGHPAQMRSEFGWIVWLMVFIVPAISMRMVSEEFRSGTIEALMTAPVSDTQVIVGKWFGAMGFLVAMLLPLVVLTIVLAVNADPDPGPLFTGFIGLLAVGGLYLAIGIFASALTENQIIAFLITVLVTGFLSVGLYMVARHATLPGWLTQSLIYLNVNGQFDAFGRGLLDTSAFVYFLSGIGLFLFFAVKVLESRRWR